MLGEFFLLAVVISVVFFRLYRKKSKELAAYKNQPPPSPVAETKHEPPPEIGIEDHINQAILLSKNQLEQSNDDHQKLLEIRIAFLESEVNALLDDNAGDDYWTNLYQRLAVLIPANDIEAPTSPNQDNVAEELAELDDLTIAPSMEIPTLNEEVVVESPADADDNTQPGTTNKDIKRLRSILSKQVDAITELKQGISGETQDAQSTQNLGAPIEELEVSHAQFNMCINTIEKEITRLTALLEANSDTTEATSALQDEMEKTVQVHSETQQRLQAAEATISNLENINETQFQEIERLQNEIAVLKTQQQEKQQLLEKHEADQSDLSKLDEDDDTLNPDIIQQEIDTINEELETKEQALTELQSQNREPKPEPSPILDDVDLLLQASTESQPSAMLSNKENQVTADDKTTPPDSQADPPDSVQSILDDFDLEGDLKITTSTNLDKTPTVASTSDEISGTPVETEAETSVGINVETNTETSVDAAADASLDSSELDLLASGTFDYEDYLNNETSTDDIDTDVQPETQNALSEPPLMRIDDEVINQSDLDDFNYEDYLNDEAKTDDSPDTATKDITPSKTASQ